MHPGKLFMLLISLALTNAAFGHLALRWFHQTNGVTVEAKVLERHRRCSLKGGRSIVCPEKGERHLIGGKPVVVFNKYDVTLAVLSTNGETQTVRVPEDRVGRSLKPNQMISVSYKPGDLKDMWKVATLWDALLHLLIGLFGLYLFYRVCMSQRFRDPRPV